MQLSQKQIESAIRIFNDLLEGKYVSLGDDHSLRKTVASLSYSFQAQSYYEAYRLSILKEAHTEDWRAFISLGRTLRAGVIYTDGSKGRIDKMWVRHIDSDIDNRISDVSNAVLTSNEKKVLAEYQRIGWWKDLGLYWLDGEPQYFIDGFVQVPTKYLEQGGV